MSKKSVSFWLCLFLGIMNFTTLSAQTEYHWSYPECNSTVDNICVFEDRTLVINAIWCEGEDIDYQVHLVALESGVEVTETNYESTQLLFSFAGDDQVNLIMRTADALQMVSLNPQLEEVAVHDLGLPYSAHIFNAIKLETGFLITSLSGSLVSFTVYNDAFEVIDSHTMLDPTLAYPSKLTFAELLENGEVLVSLNCERTIYLDLDDLANSQWLSVLANNCMYWSVMVFNPDFGGSICSMTTLVGENSDLDEIWMVFHDEVGTTSSFFSIATDRDLWAGAAEIQATSINYSALSRVVGEPEESSDFAFYRTDLEGYLYFSYEHLTPDRLEYGPYLTETSEGFWLYSSDRAYDAELLDAFALYIPKTMVSVEEQEAGAQNLFSVEIRKGQIQVSHSNNEPFEVMLYDLHGRQLYDQTTAFHKINTHTFPPSIYVLKCAHGSGELSRKIVVGVD